MSLKKQLRNETSGAYLSLLTTAAASQPKLDVRLLAAATKGLVS